MNYPLLCKLLGWVFVVLALAFGSCLAIGYWIPAEVGENQAMRVFGSLTILSFALATLLFIRGRHAVRRIFRKEALAVVGLGWIMASLIGAFPYYWILEECDFSSALFESTSGLSTTGASVFSHFEGWPRSLLFWRQLSQWIGGLGVVVLFVAILSLVGAGARILFFQENNTDHQDLTFGRIQSGVAHLFFIYLLLSVLCFCGYQLAGMDWFDALAHMLSTVSTAGFSIHPGSIGGYQNLGVELVAMLFMGVCGMTFFILIRARRYPRELLRDTEIQVYLWILVIGTLIATGYLAWHGEQPDWALALRVSSFQIVSTLTTTGFTTADYAFWPAPLLSLILGCMIIGGCSGSTSGGVKVIRVILLFKICRNAIEKSFRPKVYRPVRLKGKVVNQTGIESLMTYILLMVLILGISFALISIFQHGDLSMEAQYSAVLACFFNVGPGLGEVGPAGNYSGIHPPAKILLSFLMIMGRLEIFAVLALFSPSLWKRFQ